MAKTGKCLCGAVTFSAETVDPHVHGCHCTMCVKWAGAPMMAVSTARVTFGGSEHIARYDSSAWARRGFCSRCGTNLFYQLKESGDYIMCMGAFDDQTGFELAGEIFVDEKAARYDFAGEHPRQTGAEFLASMGLSEPQPGDG